MKTNKEILDIIGEKLIADIYDDGIKYYKQLSNASTKWGTGKEYSEVLNKLNPDEKNTLSKYIQEVLSTTIFGFLNFFEENDDFKLIYEEDGNQVDLVKISEMLKAEPIIENGWIERYSKEIGRGE